MMEMMMTHMTRCIHPRKRRSSMSNENRVWNDKGEIPMHIYKTKNMENKYVHWSVTLKELNAFEMDVIYNLVRGFRKC